MRLSLALSVFFLLFSLSGFSQENTFTFKAKVHAYGETLKGASIEVYESGDLVYETISKGGGKFEFELMTERQYLVEISMEGLRSKTVWINTKNTKELTFKVPTFSFDIDLKKDKISPYDELSEIPVTLIKYQPKKKEFYMDKTYENAVKNKKQSIKESGLQMR